MPGNRIQFKNSAIDLFFRENTFLFTFEMKNNSKNFSFYFFYPINKQGRL